MARGLPLLLLSDSHLLEPAHHTSSSRLPQASQPEALGVVGAAVCFGGASRKWTQSSRSGKRISELIWGGRGEVDYRPSFIVQ